MVKRVVYLFILILFAATFHSFLFPKSGAVFNRILQDPVYATSDVTSILQDSEGFIWFGTTDGLCRYDGYKCVVYKQDSTKGSPISSSNIRCLYLDRDSVLWIGTDNGLNKFDWESETFTGYYSDEGDSESLSNNMITAIFEDSSGSFWVGTYSHGLNLFDRKDGKCKRYLHNKQIKNSLSHNGIQAILEDFAGYLWVGTQDGLNRFDRDRKTFKRYHGASDTSGRLSHNNIWTIYEDSDGILWIGTWGGGLNRYVRETDKFIPYPIKGIYDNISSILEDRDGLIWVGNKGSGLYRISKVNISVVSHFQNDEDFAQSLSSNKVEKLYKDRTGLLWIGTFGGGLNTYQPRKRKFSFYEQQQGRTDSLSNSTVLSFYEDPGEAGEVLWIGTYYGLNRFDRKKKSFDHFTHDPANPDSISNNKVRHICKDGEGILWLGTDNGLNRFDRKTGKFTSFHSNEKNPGSISKNDISTIYEDSEGFLWIGTVGGGLNRFNRKEQSFSHFKYDADNPDSISGNTVFCIHEQRSSDIKGYILWIGTHDGGLNKFIVQKNKFVHFKADPDRSNWLNNNSIRSIYEDNRGALWLGTDGGLNRFEPEKSIFTVYTVREGLADNTVYGILEDDAGYLWLSTGNGLSRFDVEKKIFSNFNIEDGLGVVKFTHNSYWKNKSNGGEMFFGGENGFISFHPSLIEINTNIPSVVVTAFKTFNQPQSVHTGDILKKSIIKTTEIPLPNNDYSITFEFAALDFNSPKKNKYAYMLENHDNDWKFTDAKDRIASYMNVGHGSYVFRVKGSNNDGVWNEEGVSLKIVVSPPLWKNWWFRGVAGFLLVFCVVAGYKWRTKLLREKLVEKERVQKILEKSKDDMERSRNLAEFRNAENEKLIAAISSIFIAVDSDGKIFQWNHSSKKFFRMSENHVKDRPFIDLLEHYIPMDKLKEIIQLGLHREKPSSSIEIPVRFKISNESKLLLATINPIIDRSGRKFGFLLLAEDITHRKKEQMQQFLSQKLEALGQMAAGIAHEIRSPLQYIGDNGRFLQEAFDSLAALCDKIRTTMKRAEEAGGKIETKEIKQLLEDSDFDFFSEEIPKASEQIVNGVIRVSNIVKSMNEFSHTEDGVSGKSDLNEMLKTTLVVAHNRLKKVADIQTDYARDLPGIPCGMGELNQVFLNLLLNAADAIAETGKRGVIKVSTTRNGSELIVRITDNGSGIPEENKDKIFTPFFTTKGVGKGTGQGLPFSYRIVVERHKGRLYFDSQAGKGTTFYIHLPIHDNPGEF